MNNNKGTVLIIVLVILTGLAAIAAQLSKFVLYDHALANLNKRTIQSKLLAESGENLAVKLMQYNLSMDKNKKKYSINELTLAWQSIMNSFESDDYTITITDENSLFPINNIFVTTDDSRKSALAHQQIFKNLLVNLMFSNGYTGTENNAYEIAEEILNAILIWGGQTELSDEDIEKYIMRPSPCFPPKRPLKSPQELNLIAWPSINQTLLDKTINGSKEQKGLKDLISVWSNGPMNIIFLEPILVQSLCDRQNSSKEFMQQILTARLQKENINENNWYREIFERFALELPNQNILSHASRVFRFYTQIGSGNNKTTMISICTIYEKYIKWNYKNIQ